jgi:ABC-type dipeptide/oligopeptide/nickel transport systems, permease components
MAETVRIPAEKFRVVGKNDKKMETISRPNISYWKDAWRRICRNKVALCSLMLIVLYVLLALFEPLLSPYTAAQQDVNAMNQFFSPAHWLGTDSLGRDLCVRVFMGARVSLSIGFAAAVINSVIGSLIGGVVGYYGGKVDMIVMRIVDILYGIPSLIVTILIMVVLGSGVSSLIFAMVIVGWLGNCRMVRGEVMKLKEQDFVLAARVLGVRNLTIIVKHILPNVMGIILTNLTLAIPYAIFSEAFLSFIGIGIAPPNSSWGILAKDGIAMLWVAPYQLLVPSFFICTTMLALNLLGDGLRDAFDPKLRGTD